jgi:ferrous-iron efflux pump FieF
MRKWLLIGVGPDPSRGILLPMNPREDRRARLLRTATNASVATAVTLAGAKLIAWSLSGSVAILASMVDSMMDAGASLLTAAAVRYALKPADDDHRFGHGKSEALAGLAQAVLITGSAAFLVVHAVDRLLHPRAIEAITAGILVMSVSAVATLGLVLFQRYVVRETGSGAIKGDALHFVGDLATNLSTILGLALASAGWTRLDPIFGIGIAASTLYGALHIGWDTFQVLMDREVAVEVQERIRSIALAHAEVTGVHDLRTRQSGATTLIQFHLEMDGRISLYDAHRISDEVEHAIQEAFPGADVVIHEDPTGAVEVRQFR